MSLDQLEPAARQALELHYRANLSRAETAAYLKRSESAVDANLSRARREVFRIVAPASSCGHDGL